MVQTPPASSPALQDELIRRDALLASVNAAAQCLLTTENWQQAIPEVLKILGEGAQQDRVYVFKNTWNDLGEVLWEVPFEWDAPGIPSQIEAGTYFPLAFNAFPLELVDPLQKGQAAKFLRQDLGGVALELNENLEALSLVAVPIQVDGDWWGVLGFDDCTTERVWSEAEVAVLHTAASCIGAAIQRDRIRQAREAAERQAIRDKERAAQERARWLSAVAETANLLLQAEDYEAVFPQVVKLLGKAVASDRCAILQTIAHPTTGELGVVLLAEHCQAAVQYSVEHTPLLETFFPWTSVPEFYEQLVVHQDHANFLVNDLQEPGHSIFVEQGNTSMSAVPIVVNGQHWGLVSFDNCGAARLYDEAEMASLQVAADCIASAITRQIQNDALRESEERYRNLFEVSSEGLYRFEYDEPIDLNWSMERQVEHCRQHLYVAEANAAYAAMYGVENLEAVVGLRLGEIHTESEQNHDFLRALIENGHQIQTCESEERDRQGNIHYFLNSVISRIRDGKVYGGWGAQLDITELKQAQHASEEAQRVILEERNRLAREIHDTLAQSFTGISIHLEVASRIADAAQSSAVAQESAVAQDPSVMRDPSQMQVQEHINRARDFARKGLSEARRSVLALRSGDLENDELADALRKALAIAAEGKAIETQFYLEGEPVPLPDDIQLNLLRIGQESITNTLRHAQAQQLDLTLCFSPQSVRLRIADNGIGFDPDSLSEGGGFGLMGIHERVTRLKGQVELRSTPDVGTSLDVLIPRPT